MNVDLILLTNNHNFGFRGVEGTVHGDWHFYTHLFLYNDNDRNVPRFPQGGQVAYFWQILFWERQAPLGIDCARVFVALFLAMSLKWK